MKVVIIGGVAAGPKAAAKIIRLMPEAEVTILEKGEFLSYAGCGLPYYISGEVKEQKELMTTPAGTVRDSAFFQKVKNIKVRNHTEALEIDRAGKRVKICCHKENNTAEWISYDKLVLATGAKPVVPPLPGITLKGVYTLHGVEDAEGIKSAIAENRAREVVIVGGGLIGVEMAEALVMKGCHVTLVEMLPQIMNMLDLPVAALVAGHMASKGVRILTSTTLKEVAPRLDDAGAAGSVITSAGVLPADMVVLSVGVRPNVDLARTAGLEINEVTRAIQVDDRMRTSDPDIYAAGDCTSMVNLITGKPCYVPLGSTANKQGRVAAVNLCGGNDTFPGVLGSTVCKVFDYVVAATGLSEKAARAAGYDVETVLAPAPDRAHFMPGMKPLLLKIVADRKTRRLLGLQATGSGEGDKRADVAVTAITAGMTVDQVANLDLCYAPPYAPAMDNLITAANIMRNKLDGLMEGISPEAVYAKQEAGEKFFLLDVRTPGEFEQVRIPGATLIPLGAVRSRLTEIPRDREVIVFCKISLRGYEAALMLKAAGYERVKVMDGGLLMWPYKKEMG